MKGIMIYESPFMGVDYVSAIKLNDAVYEFELRPSEAAKATLSGSHNVSSQAKCSKEDTYDFETGALIALMKMCGLEKSAKAYAEIFDDTAYGDALIERDKLKEENERLCREIEVLRGANKYLLSESAKRLRDKINLKAENEKLKLDCEKLQKGYLDTDMIFCGGRQNGKQYTFLVDLFKKIDQKKVDAAYKEAYNTKLPLWQKEVLNSLYGFHKESATKSWFTTQPENFSFEVKYVDSGALEALRGCHKKPVSKREQMWDDILAPGRTSIYVKAEDVADFLDECTIVGVTWISGIAPNKQRPYFKGEGVYFFIESSKGNHLMTWQNTTACLSEAEAKAKAAIHYIRPMRWDLFEKGRIVVKVNKENHSEFCSRLFSHFTKVGISSFNRACKFGYLAFNKDTNYVESILSSDCDDIKEINRRKVVDWEDVR